MEIQPRQKCILLAVFLRTCRNASQLLIHAKLIKARSAHDMAEGCRRSAAPAYRRQPLDLSGRVPLPRSEGGTARCSTDPGSLICTLRTHGTQRRVNLQTFQLFLAASLVVGFDSGHFFELLPSKCSCYNPTLPKAGRTIV